MFTTGLLYILLVTVATAREGVGPGDQEWGFYEVRPGAHMFYWLYYTQASSDRPLVIWIQGGPGSSGTGYGNFLELGVLDDQLNERNTTWVNEVNVLFIDNPVGTGFSYVEDFQLFTTNNHEIAVDLVNFTSQFLQQFPDFSTVPTYIIGESYGGKMVPQYALYLQKEIDAGNLQMNLKGVALGDGSVSPVGALLAWPDYAFNTGLLDYEGYYRMQESVQAVKDAADAGEWGAATRLWSDAQRAIKIETLNADLYNILEETAVIDLSNPTDTSNRKTGGDVRLPDGSNLMTIMNGVVKEKLGIPDNVTWGWQSGLVMIYLIEDFLKPVTDVVERLLNETTLDVAVFSGQLDLMICTPGTLKWVQDLKWSGGESWRNAARTALGVDGVLEGYVKKYEHLSFYWINRAGHMIPVDNPYAGLEMLRQITHYDE